MAIRGFSSFLIGLFAISKPHSWETAASFAALDHPPALSHF